MARKFLVSIDLNKNELQNGVIQNLGTAPSSPVAGQIYYNTNDNELYFYNGTAWESTQAESEVLYGLFSARPAASVAGRLYYATDQALLYFDNGTTWAQVSAFGSVTAQTSYGASSGSGSSNSYARTDHTHGTPSLTSNAASTQAIGDSATVGTGTAPARDDHKHAMPAFGTVTGQTTYGASSGNGSSANIARADHTHGTPSLSTNVASNITATSAANGTGTAPAKDDHVHGFTPGNFAISAFGQATASVNLNSNKIINLADPTSAQDGATKAYVDSVAQGLDVKASVHVATTTNGTLATSFANGQTVDGVALVTGDRILIKNQTTASENGIYTVNATGAPTRATDMNTGAEFPGAFTFVEEGTTNADTGWVCTNNTPVTVGSTAITFAQFSGAGTYIAGNGLTLTGNTFAVGAGTGISVGASTVSIDSTVATLTGSQTLTNKTISGANNTLSNIGNSSLTNSSVTVNGTAIALGASGTVTANTTNALTLGTGLTGTSFNGSAAVTAAIDTSVVVRKYAASVGDGTSTAITVTHNLNTRDVQVTLYDNTAPYAEVIADVEHTTVNTVTLRFSVAPTSNQYRVVVHG